ncbi:hypothetical protein RUM43_013803 [Polyplax serrata]|uniref:Uncharacterized protein n=1 Tax=Polyplax serrata TaxID=468196 RepID=A0AAN8S6X6_POLSC
MCWCCNEMSVSLMKLKDLHVNLTFDLELLSSETIDENGHFSLEINGFRTFEVEKKGKSNFHLFELEC